MFSQPLADTPKVSVIVPVWNSGSEISRCIGSLRNQTLEDIEMIFVDDCGTDDSMDVVRTAAMEDRRIVIMENSENLGPGISRNNGIDVARGEYLAFIDADDYVNPVFLERLYTKAVADKLDIVKGKHVYEKENGTIANQYELNEIIRKDFKSGKPLFYLFNYQHQSAIYKRTFLMKYGICFGTSYIAEDTTFLLKACHKAKAFGLEEDAQYHYCEQRNSLLHDMHPLTFERKSHALREKMDYIVKNMAEEETYLYVMDKVLYDLMLCAYYMREPECFDAAVRFVADVRGQVLRFPQLEKLKRESFVIRVLCDYGVALAQRPFLLSWASHRAADYVGTVSEWIDFVIEHPDCMNDAEADLYRLFSEAFMLCKKENGSDGIKRSLMTQARRLPLRQRILVISENSPSFVFKVVKKMIRIKKGVGTFLKKKVSQDERKP